MAMGTRNPIPGGETSIRVCKWEHITPHGAVIGQMGHPSGGPEAGAFYRPRPRIPMGPRITSEMCISLKAAAQIEIESPLKKPNSEVPIYISVKP